MKALIGTKNPGKIEGAKLALLKFFENVDIEGIKVNSNVNDQPIDEDIYLGAKNRCLNLINYAKQNNINADFFMAVESGLSNKLGKPVIINVACIINKEGKESFGTSAGFPVPQKYLEDIKRDTLGTVMDKLFNSTNLNIGTGGAGILTHGVITRIDLNYQSFVMALTTFVNGKLWQD